MIENIVTAWKEILPSEEPDYTVLDGYDELPEDLQLKVRTAITQGHVDDSDWKGVSQPNFVPTTNVISLTKPGSRGQPPWQDWIPRSWRSQGQECQRGGKVCCILCSDQRSNLTKKKVATTEGSDANDDTVPADKPKSKPKKVAPGKKAAANEDSEASGTEETEQKPAANTKKPRVKKPATAANADAPPKKRGRPAKAAATETAAQPAKKGTKRKTSEEEAQDSEPEKPKRARGKVSKTSTLPNDDETAPPTKAARGRKKASKE